LKLRSSRGASFDYDHGGDRRASDSRALASCAVPQFPHAVAKVVKTLPSRIRGDLSRRSS